MRSDEIRYKNAIIRVHGEPDMERVKEATYIFMKKVMMRKKEDKRVYKRKTGTVGEKQIQNR